MAEPVGIATEYFPTALKLTKVFRDREPRFVPLPAIDMPFPQFEFDFQSPMSAPVGLFNITFATISEVTAREEQVTKVTFTAAWGGPSIQLVVWQFWGRAAEAS